MPCRTFILIILLAVTSASLVNTPEENYVKFVLDVTEYYQSSYIIILHDDNNNDMDKLTNLEKLSRAFSKARSSTVTIRFSQTEECKRLIDTYLMRPIVVVLLDSRSSVDGFIQLTTGVNVKRPVWIVPSTNHIESYVENYEIKDHESIIRLTYNTDVILMNFGRGTLYEWNSFENRIDLVDLGTWGPRKGLVMNVKNMVYQGHSNLRGRTLRVSVVPNQYLIRFVDDKLTGFYGDLLTELSIAMNFKIDSILCNSYGSRNKIFGNWSGSMSLISSNLVDIGIGGYAVTLDRLRDIDFTLPLFRPLRKLYYRQPDVSLMHFAFRQAIEQNILIIAGPLIFIVPVLLTIITVVRGQKIFVNVVIEYYLQTLGIFCQQGTVNLPVDLSTRLVYLSLFLSSMIICAAYSGTLVSSLASSFVELPFVTIDSFVRDGSYKLMVTKNSAAYDAFALSNDPLTRKMFSMLTNDLPVTHQEAFDQVCKRKVAMYIGDGSIAQASCKVVSIEIGRNSIALALPKHSPHRELINYYLWRFKENGMLNRLIEKYIENDQPVSPHRIEISLDNVSSALVLIIGGIIWALTILFFEIIYFKYEQRCCKVTRSPVLKRVSHKVQRFKGSWSKDLRTCIVDSNMANFLSARFTYKSHMDIKVEDGRLDYVP